MVRKRGATFLSIVLVIIGAGLVLPVVIWVSSWGEGWFKPKEDPQLLLRARQFYEYLAFGKYGALWELADTSVQLANKKEEYVKTLEDSFRNVEIFGFSAPKVVKSGSGWAVTEVGATLVHNRSKVSARSEFVCERTWWVLRENGWRFANASVRCDYEINDDEIAFLKRSP